jgi:ABC-type lipoprotein release transport system permease subunit
LAVLKTLGFSPRQVRATIAWQATTLAAIGLLVGVPVGVFVGVQIWRRVAESLGVALTTPARLSLIALIPLALFLVSAIAFAPARTAARLRPAVLPEVAFGQD